MRFSRRVLVGLRPTCGRTTLTQAAASGDATIYELFKKLVFS